MLDRYSNWPDVKLTWTESYADLRLAGPSSGSTNFRWDVYIVFVLGLAQESVHMYLNYIGSVVSDKPVGVGKIVEDTRLLSG